MLEALATHIGGTVQIGILPAEPDNIIVLSWSGGSTPEREFGKASATIRKPSFQIRSRNKSYLDAFTTLEAAIIKTEGYNGILGTTKVALISQIGDIMPMGRDTNGRYEFSVNFGCIIDGA